MSKINEMIKELCPNGVVELRLGDVCAILNGYTFQSKKYVDEGYRVIRISDVQSGYISDKDKVFYPCELHNEFKRQELFLGDLVMSLTGNPGRVALIGPNDIPCALNQRVACLRVFPEKCLTKYLFYTFNSPKFEEIAYANSNGGGQKNLSTTWLSNYEIPLPPLPIQQEIVNILDKFSSLIDNLDETIQLRQKQYEYYREKLLSFEEGECEWKKLGDIADFRYGYTDKAKDVGNVRYIRITDISTDGLLQKTDAKFLDLNVENQIYLLQKSDLLMARTGATFGKTLYFDSEIPSVYASFLIKISFKDISIINPRYYWMFSKSSYYWNQANQLVGGGAQPQFNANAVSEVKIPIPSIDRQQEIVATLDKFEAMISNLKQERELRQKQYEYYREKLLTFD